MKGVPLDLAVTFGRFRVVSSDGLAIWYAVVTVYHGERFYVQGDLSLF